MLSTMVTICQKCGDRGFSVALIYCDRCSVYAQHRYCLDVLPATFDEYVIWFCADCEPKIRKLSTVVNTNALPSGISHSVNLKNVLATQSRIRLQKNLERLKIKVRKTKNKKKRKNITGSLSKMGKQICKKSPSLQLKKMHSGDIFEKDKKLGQELRVIVTDGANYNYEVELGLHLKDGPNLVEEAVSVNPSLRCNETLENCEGQKVRQELVLHLKDGTNLVKEAISCHPSLQCNEMLKNCEEGQKVEQELGLYLKDGTNLVEEAVSVNPSLRCSEKPENCEGQKVGQELGLHLKDESNLVKEAISVNPSLRCNEKLESCEDQKVGQELGLQLKDETNLVEEAVSVNPYLRCNETLENCEGQKVGQELGLHLKDGTNLVEEAVSVTPSLCCNQTLENCEGQKPGHKFIVDLKDETKFVKEAEYVKTSQIATSDPSNTLKQKCYVTAQPIIDPIWRGSLCIRNRSSRAVGLVAHLSCLACYKVCEEAKLMPELLYAELFRRSDVWPKGFEKQGPSDQSIALYFFPKNESDGKAFEGLVDSMISQDLAMRSMVQNAELLVFTSTILPVQYRTFQAKFYLWGVFRRKQAAHVTNTFVPEVEKTLTNALNWDRRSSSTSLLSNSDSRGSDSLYSFCASVF
ncbi:uncharacterized protein LOC142622649 isoform X1 [Castanea sativa]|uniref:uncharacterized protein LOC142622649 isoform X1 n=1 Tax=Castanea sativa TaxID=21020 RepID=UPI003F64E6F0